MTVTTKNDEGDPFPPKSRARVSWTNRCFYIQSDYAGDLRQFYFGTKRNQAVQTQSTMNQKVQTGCRGRKTSCWMSRTSSGKSFSGIAAGLALTVTT